MIQEYRKSGLPSTRHQCHDATSVESRMRRFLTAAAVTAAVFVLTPVLSAQWAAYEPAGVPKGPDGKPNLTAPPPRMPDGKIDLSGVWVNVGRGGRGRGQEQPAP